MSLSTKTAILDRIRRANGASGEDAARKASVAERLASRPRGIIPERGQLPPAERVALFVAMAEAAVATVALLPSIEGLPAEVARYLRERNLPATIRLGSDARLARADFTPTAIEVSRGPSDGEELNSLSHAEAGIAETGTLVLVSGQANPTSLNFLPENHIVVIDASTIEGSMEDAFAAIRRTWGEGMARTINTITGPSRSADIEQTLLLGAHGPKSLHIVVIDDL
ncbi:lactate utilization protein [Fulvimarina sp. 2208YS6-2-32]|uniref:Lactate utilization protein n=1 Tax=Fulvimarina uroteuthidis TaxID=3098149 RepID=A0ABU5HZM6_9HYPH|nr:lactate utilization protein [Fulvimarina sp. 2208YS6-2-32]MDY8108587.1 lactate utilization protein [Fulvimarina sp. 2208YS6-2-32]